MSFNKLSAIAVVLAFGVVVSACQAGQGLSQLITDSSVFSSNAAPPERVSSAAPSATISSCDPVAVKSPLAKTDWLAVYKACPASPTAAYNAGRSMLLKGNKKQARVIVKRAVAEHPGDAGLKNLAASIDNPFGKLSDIAAGRLAAWLKRPSEVGEFKRPPPEKPKAPPLPKLVKDEFETASEFQARVEKARRQRKQTLTRIEKSYAGAVAAFNDAVKAHNGALKREQKARQAEIPEMRRRFIGLAMSRIMGNPEIRGLKYDAENSLFHGRLVSANRNFDKKVTIKVPRAVARDVKSAESRLKPRLRFDVSNGELSLKGLRVSYGKRIFAGDFTDENFQPVVMTASVENTAPSFSEIKTMRAETLNTAALAAGNDNYFRQALKFKDDPELARLRQKQAEVSRRKRELERERALKAQKDALLASIRSQQKELAAMKGVATGFPLKPVAVNYIKGKANPDDVAVIIGNADYRGGKDIPNVTPAYADAAGIRQYVKQSLGVADDNIIFLKDATQAEMTATFGSGTNPRGQLFNYVKPGKSRVFVYYSGHGAPGGKAGDSYIVPSDAQASLIELNGYPLKTLYRNLAEIPAKSMTVVLESCFSGASQSGSVISNASPIYLKAKETGVPPGITVIAAGAANQIASWERDKSSGLFTKYFLKGMSGEADAKPYGNQDGHVGYDELGRYLKATLTYYARRYYGREQTAQIVVGK